MVVIIMIGIKDAGSFQPIKIAAGSSTKNENRIPFKIGVQSHFVELFMLPIPGSSLT